MEFTHVQRVRVLYKTIMKLHRGLPPELQPLGDSYARDEFKRHKTSNAVEVNIFMTEWTKYALALAEQLGLKGLKHSTQLGSQLDEKLVEQMRDDQIQQLYELMNAAKATDDPIKNEDSQSIKGS